MMRDIVLVWFRQDLRTEDNPALWTAEERGYTVIPVFIWAPEEEAGRAPGGAARWWLHQSLNSLDRELRLLGSRLIIRQGPTREVLRDLIEETGARILFMNRCYEPWSVTRDHETVLSLRSNGMAVENFNGSLLFEPWKIHNRQNKTCKVFTAFWRQCLSAKSIPRPYAAPLSLRPPQSWPKSLRVRDLRLDSKAPWSKKIGEVWKPGAKEAKGLLKKFIGTKITEYDKERDRPDHDGTSRLSPYLHFGEISPRTVWFLAGMNPKARPFLRQMIWREFAYYLLYHFPHTVSDPWRREFEEFPWKADKAKLRAWQRGRTGYPIVDAGMRQLWKTGWMHNRVRMITASFLTKHLLLTWHEGAKWFWDTLVDADIANNIMGWQWVSGSGADAAPYFRIFNPVLQGTKFDPQGNYVRKWIPEISDLPSAWIHRPWQAPKDVLQKAGIRLGVNYPKPIVDHEFARRRALQALQKIIAKKTNMNQRPERRE